ncbi:MAG: peptide deformylase [Gammaproteobacteria bacterium]|nr:peptide deformylase [Gammaproteobacteria bacterium]
MTILNILSFPDPRLRTNAKTVKTINSDYKTLTTDMLETMYAAEGIGLAATQVNIHERVVVMDLSEDRNQPMIFINPEIIEKRGQAEGSEGCLSVPGQQAMVERSEWVKCRYQDLDGETHELETEGLLAICIQHELDHLQGKLFVDYLSKLKRDRIRKKLAKK